MSERDWMPTSENINRLPLPLRRFIHDIETRCDPAWEARARIVAEDTVRALEATLHEQLAASDLRVKEAVEATLYAVCRTLCYWCKHGYPVGGPHVLGGPMEHPHIHGAPTICDAWEIRNKWLLSDPASHAPGERE